ncbi:MAG: family 43 glycosylhydrolase [Faecousia sp.]
MEQIWNPFLPLEEYIPDGEPHVFGDRVYLFGSHDKEGGERFCMLDYTVYSAPVEDLKHWRCEGTVYRAEQDPDRTERNPYLYAPDVVRGNDGRYYLYYALAGDQFTSPIHVAVCNTPAGKYEFYGCVRNPDGTPYTRCITFDPAVINDEGVIRMYYGWALATDKPLPPMDGDDPVACALREKLLQIQMHMFEKTAEEIQAEPNGIMGANVVTLAEDMLTVTSEPKRIVPGQFDAVGTQFAGHAFFEASSIRKIGETYYFIYSSELNHELCYATSCYPDRDFRYRGTIVSNGDVGFQGRVARDRLNATGNNHGSIECMNGQWYVFYHRQTHKSLYSRQACAEPVSILPDGMIPQVEMTSCGLNGGPLPAVGEYPAVIACNLTNGNMPHWIEGVWQEPIPYITHGGNQRYITDIRSGTRIGYKYFHFSGARKLILRIRGSAVGTIQCLADACLLAEVPIYPSEDWHDVETNLGAQGIRSFSLQFTGEGTLDFLSFRFA